MNADRHDLFEKLARAGFAARGVVYALIGGLAVLAAFGSGGGTTGSSGALATLADSGWGKALLVLLAIGLFGYGVWRLTAAGLDLENQGSDKEGLAKRIAHAASGLFHFGLSIYEVVLIFGAAGAGSGGADSATAKVMGMPGGVWLVGLLGVAFLAAAISQAKKAVREEYKARIRIPAGQTWMDPAVKSGILARAVIFAIIGAFLIYAAITANPDEARGVGEALDWLRGQAWGGVLLGLIGLGLLGFALYSFLQARYRVIPSPEGDAANTIRRVTA